MTHFPADELSVAELLESFRGGFCFFLFFLRVFFPAQEGAIADSSRADCAFGHPVQNVAGCGVIELFTGKSYSRRAGQKSTSAFFACLADFFFLAFWHCAGIAVGEIESEDLFFRV